MALILVIGSAEKTAIAELLDRASENRINLAAMQAAGATKERPPILAEQTVTIPVGFTATYSVEEHGPGQWMKHLSLCSNSGITSSPSMEAATMILEEFHFANPVEGCEVWPEPTPTGIAVNFLEPLSGDWSERPPKQ